VLIGRDAERARLAELLADRRDAVVVGEAGVGKTALLDDVCAAAERPAFAGGALATLSWVQYLPLQRAVGRSLDANSDANAVAADVHRIVGRGVLVLDDLHWADAATITVIGMLAGRVQLLAGVRRGDPGAEPVLDLLRGAGFAVLELAPLDAAHSTSLVQSLRPELPPARVAALVARTGGNPLLLRELAATGEPSDSLRLSLAARLRQLDLVGREAFDLLALAGRPMTVDELGRAGVKSLLDAGLAVRDATSISVRHALLAEVAVETMQPETRRELHGRLARLVDDPGEAARHHEQAGERAQAHEAALRAADAATRPGERASHLALAATCASGPQAADLRLQAARALEEAHDWPSMFAVLDLITDADAETRAWMCLLRARGAWGAGEVGLLRASLAEGLALVGGTDTEVAVRLHIEHCRIPLFVDRDPAEAVRAGRAALELAQRTGFAEARAHYFLGTALDLVADPDREAHLRAAIDGARRSGDRETEFVSSINLVVSHESAGSQAVAREVALEAIERARALGMGMWETTLRSALVNLDVFAGAFEQAVRDGYELLREPLERRARDIVVEAVGHGLVDLGRFDDAERMAASHLDAAVDDYRGRARLSRVLADAAWWGGRPRAALAHIEDYLRDTERDPLNQQIGFVTRAWARFDLGLDPGPAPGEVDRPMIRAVAPEVDGVRLLHRGEHRAAVERFDAAAGIWAQYDRRGELRCAWGAGEALRLAGDLQAAVARLEAVEQRAAAAGMKPLLARVHRSLRAAGQPRSAARTDGGGGLTGREREVLDLVAEGLTNGEIAARLGVSTLTVIAQIRSASAKLGAVNRGQAAALAQQLG
jgi:DNA-binding CsgD family transcriptional regulator